jgi:Family of unknown function (DUF6348)
MKSILAMATLSSTLFGGLFGCQKPSEEVASMIAEPQGENVTSLLANTDYKVEGPTITVGNHQLEVFPYLEQCGVKDSTHVCGVRFEISANGKKDKRFTYGWVGVDNTKEAALRNAVESWWAALGAPLILSLADKTPDFSQSPYLAYPGFMGLRGAPPSGWLVDPAEMHHKIVPLVKSVLDQTGFKKVVDLRLIIDSDGIKDMGCRLDAGLSPELFQAVSGLPWPKNKSGYVFYQTYIINHKSESPM